MNCKNCNESLNENDSFCSKCGAKIVSKRLTFKGFFSEMITTYFAWDNKLFLTFWHMFSKPEKVINGFISGVRKKYMHPLHFMIVSLTFYGVYLYFAKDSLNELIQNYDFMQSDKSSLDQMKVTNVITKYFNLITFLTIPIYAIASFFAFKKYKYNFIEHNVIYIYTNAHYNFIAVLLSIIALMDSDGLMMSQLLLMLITFVYYPYIFLRIFNLNLKQIIGRSILYLLLFILFFLLIIIIGVVVFILFEKVFNLQLNSW